MSVDITLKEFEISPETGFVPATPPLKSLPGDYFSPWESLMKELPERIKEKKVRVDVEQLPELEFSSNTLQTEDEWKRAYIVLCFIGQAYIWMDGQEGLVDRLPKKIAIPWCEVSDHLHLKPVISYTTTAPFNYALRDPQKPLSGDNIYAISTFTGTDDESYFYMVALAIELVAVPSVRAIESAFKGMSSGDDLLVQQCLETMQGSLVSMTKELNKMFELCDSLVFYLGIRPFQAGSKGLDAFPEGIVYEGVSDLPKQFHGASAGQTPTIHAFDIFLGATHYGSDKEFLEVMRQYMPRNHRLFLERLQELPSVRSYCQNSGNAALIKSYNFAVQGLAEFRTAHVIVVTRYIVNQQSHSVNPTLDTKGSGGTEFMTFLKTVRDNTLKLCI